jgi:tetratricopeptide (TPR) repeat protein
VVWALARALAATDRLAEADAQVRAVLAWDEPERLRRRALLRRGSERVDGLGRAFAAGSARALWDLVRVHDAAGRSGDAVAALEVLVERDPGDAQAWVELARRAPEQRREALERALQADPCSHTALRELGSLTGDTALLRRAWEASPADPDVLDAYGLALHGAGRIEEGLELLSRAAAGAPTVERLSRLEVLWRAAGREGSARDAAHRRAQLRGP